MVDALKFGKGKETQKILLKDILQAKKEEVTKEREVYTSENPYSPDITLNANAARIRAANSQETRQRDETWEFLKSGEPVAYSPEKLQGLKFIPQDQAKRILGGKGYSLANIARLSNEFNKLNEKYKDVKIQSPNGATIPAYECVTYRDITEASGNTELPDRHKQMVRKIIHDLEESSGKKVGDPKNPLLVAARSGARESMPGMMDTVLFLMLDRETVEARIKYIEEQKDSGSSEWTQDSVEDEKRFLWDSYQRNLSMYAHTVKHIGDATTYVDIIDNYKSEHGKEDDTDLNADDLKAIAGKFENLIKEKGEDLPPHGNKENLIKQVEEATATVFSSYYKDSAVKFREREKKAKEEETGRPVTEREEGTAVSILEMYFGNRPGAGTLVIQSSRDKKTGERSPEGRYLTNAAGEDVVVGARGGKKLVEMPNDKSVNPEIPQAINDFMSLIEDDQRIFQDIEMTWERSADGGYRLIPLQSRTARLHGEVRQNAILGLERDGVMTTKEAIKEMKPGQFAGIMAPRFEDSDLVTAEKNRDIQGQEPRLLIEGEPGSVVPGAAAGVIAIGRESAEKYLNQGKKVILVTKMTTDEDMDILHNKNLVGVITKQGGAASHAMVVCSGYGYLAVAGADKMDIQADRRDPGIYVPNKFAKNGREFIKEGTMASLNGQGDRGQLILGELQATKPQPFPEEYLDWLQGLRRSGHAGQVKIRTNAEVPAQITKAKEHRAEGVGLFRLEHTFLQNKDIKEPFGRFLVGAMDEEEAANYLNNDFVNVVKSDVLHALDANTPAKGSNEKAEPVTIRQLDPPIEEFVKTTDRVERDPSFGLNATKLAVSTNVGRMQINSILTQIKNNPEKNIRINIPGAILSGEIIKIKSLLDEEAKKLGIDNWKSNISFGLTVRSASTCMEIDKLLNAFGDMSGKVKIYLDKNRLTESVLGLSQYDFQHDEKFRKLYLETYKVYDKDPFDRDYIHPAVKKFIRMLEKRGEQSISSFKVEKYPMDAISTDTAVRVAFDGASENLCKSTLKNLSMDKIGDKESQILNKVIEEQNKMLENDLANRNEATVSLFAGNLEDIFPEESSKLVEAHAQKNNMIGYRAARLCLGEEALTRASIRAILLAADELIKQGRNPHPKIEIPIVTSPVEVRVIKGWMDEEARKIWPDKGVKGNPFPYSPAVMVEVPAAAVMAEELLKPLSEGAETYEPSVGIGTNDMTQTVYSYARDDAPSGAYVGSAVNNAFFSHSPFSDLIRDGAVDRLLRYFARKARQVIPDLNIDICGVQGGRPIAIDVCTEEGINLSVVPDQVPGAYGYEAQTYQMLNAA